ncbi:glutathione S-transferase family protein [Sphingomonas donggukensis]|uniref:Glutathione S-transferase family protein n=1 Tax=Sphingomonas donggukensis TaxID=2949093 RepID=A0ABY4TXD4_9SPHN|nr:glutathione S-transferase family protein [Sphingomonas donggukensis]URW76525.1 glutathione S-transferase family protein [Sphingomonas donggukensis]
MLFYDTPLPAPNPRRVRIVAAEKGIVLPTVTVQIAKSEHKAPEFLAVNPLGQTPALVLDDGEVLTESIAICRYLDALHPEPPLFGRTPIEIARVDMWMRRVEFRLGNPLAMLWIHAHPFTAKIVPQQFREFGDSNRPAIARALALFDTRLADTQWLAGDSFSIADVVLLCTIDFMTFVGIKLTDETPHLKDWHMRASSRPSATA